MDRARRAEPYSNATIWTREIAKNLASHLARVANAHSCIDTRSPKTSHLPHFQHPVKKSTSRSNTHRLRHRDALLHINGDSQDATNQEVETENTLLAPPEQTRKVKSNRNVRLQSIAKPSKHLDRQTAIDQENQRLLKQITRIALSKRPELSSYEGPTGTMHKRGNVDYHKKQEQLKIWQENRVLSKRIRTAKPTLDSKQWERDEKRNRRFLEVNEKRRKSLQHELSRELMRIQGSPTTCSKQLKTIESTKKMPLRIATSHARKSGHIDLKDESSGIRAVTSDVAENAQRHPLDAAANHRRILLLREQHNKNAYICQDGSKECSKSQQLIQASTERRHSPDNDEIVEVRFALPQLPKQTRDELSGTLCCWSSRIEDTTLPPLSPAVEIERALEAMEHSRTSRQGGHLEREFDSSKPNFSNQLNEQESYEEVHETLQWILDVIESERDLSDAENEQSPNISKPDINQDSLCLEGVCRDDGMSQTTSSEEAGIEICNDLYDDFFEDEEETGRENQSTHDLSSGMHPHADNLEESNCYGSEFDEEPQEDDKSGSKLPENESDYDDDYEFEES